MRIQRSLVRSLIRLLVLCSLCALLAASRRGRASAPDARSARHRHQHPRARLSRRRRGAALRRQCRRCRRRHRLRARRRPSPRLEISAEAASFFCAMPTAKLTSSTSAKKRPPLPPKTCISTPRATSSRNPAKTRASSDTNPSASPAPWPALSTRKNNTASCRSKK